MMINKEHIISQSSYYAKMLTSIYLDKQELIIDDQKVSIIDSRDKLTEDLSVDFSYIDEIPYLIATTSSFDSSKEKMFVSHRRYIYEALTQSSINIWKHWTGLSLQDSCVFFSIQNGGKMIVYSNSTVNYFLYIMNITTNIRLKLYESSVIDDDFINVHKIYPLKRKLQKLKNNYISNEIAIKFQPVHIYQQMEKGLKNRELLEEVSENIDTTLDLTKENTDVLITAGAVVFTLGSLWEPIVNGFENNPLLTSIVVSSFTIITILVIYKRRYFIKKSKSIIRWISHKFDN